MKYAEQKLLKALTKAEVEFLGQSSIDDIVKVIEDYAEEMKVKNLSSNTVLADSTPSQECYKSGESCKYNCSGLCKESC